MYNVVNSQLINSKDILKGTERRRKLITKELTN